MLASLTPPQHSPSSGRGRGGGHELVLVTHGVGSRLEALVRRVEEQVGHVAGVHTSIPLNLRYRERMLNSMFAAARKF